MPLSWGDPGLPHLAPRPLDRTSAFVLADSNMLGGTWGPQVGSGEQSRGGCVSMGRGPEAQAALGHREALASVQEGLEALWTVGDG